MTRAPVAHSGGITRFLHSLFKASLAVKGTLAATEALIGLGLLVTTNPSIMRFVNWMTQSEMVADPQDKLANAARQLAEGLSLHSQHFYGFYLMAHGGLKLAMVILLARGVVWAYPAAMALLAGFVVYQMVHWTHNYAFSLLALSTLDCIMIGLVWSEWRAGVPIHAAKSHAKPRPSLDAPL